MNFPIIITLWLQDGAEPGFFNPINLLFAGSIMLVFWWFVLRPQSKKIQEQNTFIEELGKGHKVVTMGGIHGKIVKEEQDSYLVEIDSNTKIKISKTAISRELTQEVYGQKEKK